MPQALPRLSISSVALFGASFLIALSSGCGGGGTKGADPTKTQPVNIHGSASLRWVGPGAPKDQPVDASQWQVNAHLPTSTGGYRTVAGVGTNSGTFTIPAAPEEAAGGSYWLEQAPSSGGIRNFYWTNATSINLSTLHYGRGDAEPSLNGTSLLMTVGNMSPWTGQDGFEWVDVNNGNYFLGSKDYIQGMPFQPGTPVLNDTALNGAVFDWSIFPTTSNLTRTSKGDLPTLMQMRRSSTGGVDFFRPIGIFQPSSLEQAQGISTTVSGNFTSLPATKNFPCYLMNTAFSTLMSAVNPGATGAYASFYLMATPTGTSSPRISATPDLLCIENIPASAPDYQIPAVPYGNPFPSPWTEAYEITWSYYRGGYVLPGTTQVRSLTASIGVTSALFPDASHPIRPTLTPVRDPKINGLNLFQPQTGVGETPTLSWNAPATGSPTYYRVQVRNLWPTGNGNSTWYTVAYLYTRNTTIKLPPNLLTSGASYVLTIRAVNAPGVNLETAPHLGTTLEASHAECLSELISR